MDRIDRRDFMKVTGAGGVALSVGAVHNLLAPNNARAKSAPEFGRTVDCSIS